MAKIIHFSLASYPVGAVIFLSTFPNTFGVFLVV